MVAYVFIGDDFTGASDTLATLAEAGFRTRLFLGTPASGMDRFEGLDAVGFATNLRSRSPDRIVEHLTELAPMIATLSPDILHYKICSTFDSAPHTGSIGAAVETFETRFRPAMTAFFGGQPSLGRYCLFSNLFARGPDGAVHRIDRHPVMSRHPVTPMQEADLRRHLAGQGLSDLAAVDQSRLADALDPKATTVAGPHPSRLLLDIAEQADLNAAGAALGQWHADPRPLLLVGASSVAEAFAASVDRRAGEPANAIAPMPGPRLVIAGSRSSVTEAQIAATRKYERVSLDRGDLAPAGIAARADACAAGLARGANVLAHLDPDSDYGWPADALSDRLAELTKAILSRHPVGAIGVAGGDTSSAIVRRLGFESLSFEAREGSGVAVCRGHTPGSPLDGARLLLKGGQMGAVDLFDRFAG